MNALDPLAWSILLMLVGCVVLVLEVFIPSGGVLAVLSAAAFVGAILIAFQRGPVTGFTFVMTTVVAVPLVLALAFHYWPKTRIGKAFLGELPTEAESAARRSAPGAVGPRRRRAIEDAAQRRGRNRRPDGRRLEPGPGDRAGAVRRRDRGPRQPRRRPAGERERAAGPARSRPTICSAGRSKSWGSSRWKIRWHSGRWQSGG